MPVSPNSLISVINQNKTKKQLATKIVETNPKTVSIVPKLIRDKTVSGDVENDNFNVNRGLLEDIYNRIRTVEQDNKHITKLFPDIELAIQILVSSILSPKKMTDIQLNYKFNKKLSINSAISSKILENVKNYINEHYELEEKLPEIVREALFTSGAYVQAIIPESSVDDVINTDLIPSYSAEDFMSRVDYVFTKIVEPINFSRPTEKTSISLESSSVKPKTLAEYMVSNDLLNITDNANIINFAKIKDKIQSSLIRSSFKRNVAISQESLDKINYMDIFRRKNSSGVKNIEFIKTKTETTRKSISKPMIVKIPTESIIPVFIPGNESEHIGYFILLDETGKPLSTDINQNNLNQINSILNQSNVGQQTPIQKAYNNLVTNTISNFNVNELFELYKDVLEKQIYSSVKSSLYGSNTEISSKNDIYFLMFTRALADQKTNLLFIPKDLIVYFAFQYNDIGIGKTLLENLTVLSSMRAILLFSKVMAYAKQSIDVTKVNISLDPNDPDPEKTIEQIQDSVLKLRQNFFPLGMNNPVDLINWIQRAGLQFAYENNPLLPNVKIDFENANISHTIPNSELEEDLRKQSIIALGLSPESVDNGFTPEFATTVVNNNILLSKRIAIYQKALCKHLCKFIDLLIYNDEDLRSELRAYLLESLAALEESLTEDEKQLLNKDKLAFIEYYITRISQHIEVELPKPENTNIVNLAAEFSIYKENLEIVIDSIISSEIFAEDITGEISSHIDTIKNVYKHHLLRKWCINNNYYNEIFTISSENEEDIENLLTSMVSHLTLTSKTGDKLFNIMQKFKLALNKDLANISGDAATEISSNSNSDTSGTDSKGVTSDETNGDIVSDGDFNLDL